MLSRIRSEAAGRLAAAQPADRSRLRASRALLRQGESGGKRLARVRYCFRMAPAVASSVIKPLIRPPFSAAPIAETLAGPTAAPMVRALAGTWGGMLVRRRWGSRA